MKKRYDKCNLLYKYLHKYKYNVKPGAQDFPLTTTIVSPQIPNIIANNLTGH